jgi:hypothetical protein
MTKGQHLAARLSLSFLWIVTAISSIFFTKEIGLEVLEKGEITGPLANFYILSGGVVDGVIGVWLLLGLRLKTCYLLQLIVIITYTLLLTIIDPSFWIHPFGPLTKNIPLLVMIYYLYSQKSLQQ